MLFCKITQGYVKQVFNDAGEFVSQKFVAEGDVFYKTDEGDDINSENMPLVGREYQPFDMVQNAECDDKALIECREQICEDLVSRLDGLDDDVPGILDDVCDIVVDNFARFGITIEKLMDDEIQRRDEKNGLYPEDDIYC